MNLQDCFAAVLVGQVDHNPAIEAARPEQGLVQNVGLVGRRQNDDAFAAREPVHLGQNLIERLLLLARSADRGLAPGASYSLAFVDEETGRHVLYRFREQVPDAFGTASNATFAHTATPLQNKRQSAT